MRGTLSTQFSSYSLLLIALHCFVLLDFTSSHLAPPPSTLRSVNPSIFVMTPPRLLKLLLISLLSTSLFSRLNTLSFPAHFLSTSFFLFLNWLSFYSFILFLFFPPFTFFSLLVLVLFLTTYTPHHTALYCIASHDLTVQ